MGHRQVNIEYILKLLTQSYGNRIWQKRLEPVDELILTILSQNTSDTNSHRAFKSLREEFGSLEKVAAAETRQIADAIRGGGLADAKAKYIKNALMELKKKTGDFNLQFLLEMDVRSAREWLIRLPGVGMKTASCVLLFSLGMPAFPVDTHVFRVTRRLGIIDPKISVDAAHPKLEGLIPPRDIYRSHMLFIEQGRKVCKAQRPLCPICILKDICPSFNTFRRSL
ncbi:MAG: endonuclease III [Dehalococcoidia bacterium]|nr:endonuclease III [Dehalococcoidia bacterium]MDD5495041.1 endonuclease III [Dehalococcoidia bacterium]